MARFGDWLQTSTGQQMFPLDPILEEIHLPDIAASLSNLCRFNGHTSEFYSVAEHCCHVCDILPGPLKLAGLLHDASEAYLCDIPRPLKRSPSFGPMYTAHEDVLMVVIAARFGFAWPMCEEIRTADNALLGTEARQLMAPLHAEWCDDYEPVPGLRLLCWPPKLARCEFMRRFAQYSVARSG